MPKIPRARQGQRISQGTPVTAVSASAAGRGAKALGQVAQDITKLGGRMAAYEKEKQRVDMAAAKADARAQAELSYQEGTFYAMTTEKAAPDGSSMQADFEEGSQSFQKYLEGIEDPAMKDLAIREGNAVKVRHTARLFDAQIKKHNSFVLEKTETTKNKIAMAVENNPELIIEKLQEYDSVVEELPYLTGEKAKIHKAGKRDIVMSAIQGLNSRGKFDAIRKGMKDPRIAEMFSVKERGDILKTIENEEREFFVDKYNQETRRLNDLSRQQQKQKGEAQRLLLSSYIDADSPEAVAAADKLSNDFIKSGILGTTEVNAAKNFYKNDNEHVSSEIIDNLYTDFVSGTPAAVLEPRVIKAAEHGLMGKDAFQFLKSIQDAEAREARDPRYKSQRAAATSLINSTITPDGTDIYGNAFWGSAKKKTKTSVLIRISELEARGVGVLEATKISLGEVMGRANIINIPGVPANIQDDPDKLLKASQDLATKFNQRLKANKGNIDPQVRDQFLRTLRMYDEKINAWQLQKQMDELLNRKPKLKEAVDGDQ